jgi:putative solute:sodium symporter small subunit
MSDDKRRAYWVKNIQYVTALLLVWALVSFGCSILFADAFNEVRLLRSGFKLGFWFAQQGSIYVFVILIFVYVKLMNRLDKEHGLDEGPDEDDA